MSKTRVDSLADMLDIINENSHLETDDIMVNMLTEIAGSLAVIADCMTAKKDGGAE